MTIVNTSLYNPSINYPLSSPLNGSGFMNTVFPSECLAPSIDDFSAMSSMTPPLPTQPTPQATGFTGFIGRFMPNFNIQMPTFNVSMPSFFNSPTFNFTMIGNPSKSSASSRSATSYPVLSLTNSKVANIALSYKGKVNSDKEGNRLFSNGKNQAWCVDFALSCAKKGLGSKFPSKLNTSSVNTLISQAKSIGCYTTGASNISPGDIVIVAGKGASGKHATIATNVSSGSVATISGNNSKNSVGTATYANNKIIGVVHLSQFA